MLVRFRPSLIAWELRAFGGRLLKHRAHALLTVCLLQSGELEAKIQQLEADNVSLRAQLEDSATKVVQALKESKAKDAELQKLRSQLEASEKQLAELSSNMARAEGTLHRAATLSGLDEGVRQEFNEVCICPFRAS